MKSTLPNTDETSIETPYVSVLMPTFDQAPFICRAIESLLSQSMTNWELVIVDDGSPDNTHEVVKPYLVDSRIRYFRLDSNQGLGAALNYALTLAKASLIAYLPSDDVYFNDHLASLAEVLDTDGSTILAYSGVRHELRVPGKGVLTNKTSLGQMEGYPLQLVQVMHRITEERWVERDELVSDDLDRLFWSKLHQWGNFVGTDRISCQWVDHPLQRHKVIQEPVGGINPYRMRYRIHQPLRFHSSTGNLIDEVEHYRHFRDRPDTPFAVDGLKILLVGELAFNPERILALEERGHKLYGLWTPDITWFNTVGPLPFGHVEDLPQTGWREAVQQLKPDIIYALLNWNAVPFVHQVLMHNPGVPFVWHFKEGPFDCIANGTWQQLLDLYTLSDGQIYTNLETQKWFNLVAKSRIEENCSLLLDGDLPKRDWFTSHRSPRLSDVDAEIHTVVPGAPVGLHPSIVAQLAQQNIHLHLYGDFYREKFRALIEEMQQAGPLHVHLHAQVDQEHWVSELSQYDAGWLHINKSENEGDWHRVNWADLNYPARLPTLVSAGLPLIQYDNGEAIVAMQNLAHEFEIGLFYREIGQLSEQLRDKDKMARLWDNVWHHREKFTFDFHTDRLVDFFRQVIAKRNS